MQDTPPNSKGSAGVQFGQKHPEIVPQEGAEVRTLKIRKDSDGTKGLIEGVGKALAQELKEIGGEGNTGNVAARQLSVKTAEKPTPRIRITREINCLAYVDYSKETPVLKVYAHIQHTHHAVILQAVKKVVEGVIVSKEPFTRPS